MTRALACVALLVGAILTAFGVRDVYDGECLSALAAFSVAGAAFFAFVLLSFGHGGAK